MGADGRIAWSEGEENVREAIQIILLTECERARCMLPEFGGGLGRFLFEPNNVTTRHLIEDRIAKALAQWEPRIAVESVEVEADPQDPQARDRHHHLPARRHQRARAREPERDAGRLNGEPTRCR